MIPLYRLAVLSCFLTIGGAANLFAVDLSGAIDSKFQSMEPRPRMNLGAQISLKDKVLFSGHIVLRAHEKGVIVARDLKNGTSSVEVHFLQEKNLNQKPVLGISEFYIEQGGKKVYGRPIEGPHGLFGGSFRIHIFRKGVIFSRWLKNGKWEREGAVLEKDFRP